MLMLMQTMHSPWGMEDVLLKSDGSGNNDISDDANAKANATISHALCLVCLGLYVASVAAG